MSTDALIVHPVRDTLISYLGLVRISCSSIPSMYFRIILSKFGTRPAGVSIKWNKPTQKLADEGDRELIIGSRFDFSYFRNLEQRRQRGNPFRKHSSIESESKPPIAAHFEIIGTTNRRIIGSESFIKDVIQVFVSWKCCLKWTVNRYESGRSKGNVWSRESESLKSHEPNRTVIFYNVHNGRSKVPNRLVGKYRPLSAVLMVLFRRTVTFSKGEKSCQKSMI